MILHESMHKYKSQLDVLDVLNWAHSTPPATLNRQIITLLSTLGVPDEVQDKFDFPLTHFFFSALKVFFQLLENELERIADLLRSEQSALSVLTSSIFEGFLVCFCSSLLFFSDILCGFLQILHFLHKH